MSRSFYLSLRILPRCLREEISATYLLARASDTVADAPGVASATRVGLLQRMSELAERGIVSADESLCADLAALAPLVSHSGEAELLRRFGACTEGAARADSSSRTHMAQVWKHILHAQQLDVVRFPDAQPRSLAAATETMEYAYLVAGAVGEFWTDMVALKLPRKLRRPHEEMRLLGRKFGDALQLVNILRDLPRDLAEGRCYLPLDELQAVGFDGDWTTWRSQPAPFATVHRHWVARARELISAGKTYVRGLRPWRLPFAARLPWVLGEDTLALLERAPSGQIPERAKVTRGRVYWRMFQSLFTALASR